MAELRPHDLLLDEDPAGLQHHGEAKVTDPQMLRRLEEEIPPLGARTLLGAPGIATRNKKLLGAPGLTTRNKDVEGSTRCLAGYGRGTVANIVGYGPLPSPTYLLAMASNLRAKASYLLTKAFGTV